MVCPNCLNEKYSLFSSYLDDPSVVLPSSNDKQKEEIKENIVEISEETNDNGLYKKRKLFTSCPLEKNSNETFHFSNPIFLHENWYDNLCLCENCLKLNKNLDLESCFKIKDDNVKFVY